MAASLDIARANPNAPTIARTPADLDQRQPVIGLTRSELAEQFKAIGIPEREVRMRASQIWRWVYNKGAKSFDEMTNVSKVLREQLAENLTLARPGDCHRTDIRGWHTKVALALGP